MALRQQFHLLIITSCIAQVSAGSSSSDDAWPIQCSLSCQGKNQCLEVCRGEQTQLTPCKGLTDCPNELDKECPAGSQRDCVLGDWGDWARVGCTGLLKRSRVIDTINKCGGRGCSGPLEETMVDPESHADEGCAPKQDCTFSDWAEWSQCGTNVAYQKDRSRTVTTPPLNGGLECSGPLTQTQVCEHDIGTFDCVLSAWMEWSECDQECGGGERSRFRSVIQRASPGGQACTDELAQREGCNEDACTVENQQECKLGPWSDWDICGHGRLQSYRNRVIFQPALNGGEACNGESLTDTKACGSHGIAVNCAIGSWSDWSECSKTCDGGQTSRTRLIETLAANGGELCKGGLQETAGCNPQGCNVEVEHSCHVATWTDWTVCKASNSQDCALGQQTRDRTIVAAAHSQGLGCINTSLSEIRGCLPVGFDVIKCPNSDQDCKWHDWSEWTECTASCNGGQQWRSRDIAVYPSGKGDLCPAQNSSEVQGCNSQKCEEECINGEWDDWADWSTCSQTCGYGTQWRLRKVGVTATPCGKSPEGESQEIQTCGGDRCPGDVDCELDQWSDWDECSQSCNGIQKRSRQILKHGQGMGMVCGSPEMVEKTGEYLEEEKSRRLTEVSLGGLSLEQTQPCATDCLDIPNQDCVVSDWTEWSDCSSSCGVGQMYHSRSVITYPSGTGKLCEENLLETTGCTASTAACPAVVDCKWADWDEWGDCTKCSGQRFRHRKVAEAPANGGAPCLPTSAKETSRCDRTCGQPTGFCAWGSWSDWGTCSQTCGNSTQSRHRNLAYTEDAEKADIVATADSKEDCTAQAVSYQPCVDVEPCPACKPQDCILSPWTEWEKPTDCAHYLGLCRRTRSIMQLNSECGKPCNGTLESTQECLVETCNAATDCKFSAWSSWSVCSPDTTQKYREREIVVEPAHGGKMCSGELNQTEFCSTSNPPQDCVLSEWVDWGKCSKPCGGGEKYRARDFSQQAANGGRPCGGELPWLPASTKEWTTCNNITCEEGSDDPNNCVFGPWSVWSKCRGPEDEQAYRERHILHPALCPGGLPCEGATQETQACEGEGADDVINCVFHAWTEWSKCSRPCDGGQVERSRAIKQWARGGGIPCRGEQVEVGPCNEQPCAHEEDCSVGEWSEWGPCHADCGDSWQERARKIVTAARRGGRGCNMSLSEVQTCTGTDCHGIVRQDCKWASWSEWGTCVRAVGDCGYGYKTRYRGIAVLPSGGGALCSARPQSEVALAQNCLGQPICCVDGQWGDWTAWTKCSTTCGGGIRQRNREVAVKETFCGEPPVGPATEYEGCGADVECQDDLDCKFSQWSAWSVCSLDCDGTMIRSRGIAQNASNHGNPCNGSLTENQRCNPGPGEATPAICLGKDGNRDCKLSDWSDWSDCSVTCGKGSIIRSRKVEVRPTVNGLDCEPELEVIASCDAPECFPDRVDCAWDEWTEWGECDTSINQKSRSRGFLTPKGADGTPCSGSFQDTAPCGECQNGEYVCQWGDWEPWSSCSATCGTGSYSERKRYLEVVEPGDNSTLPPLLEDFKVMLPGTEEELTAKLQAVRHERNQEMALSFTAGAAALMVLLALARFGRPCGQSVIEHVTTRSRYERVTIDEENVEDGYETHAVE